MSFHSKVALLRSVAGIDAPSRAVIERFILQLGIGCALVLTPCVLGWRPWQESTHPLGFFFSLSAVINLVLAAARRQRFAAPNLNLWDASLAFSGCAALLRTIEHYPG